MRQLVFDVRCLLGGYNFFYIVVILRVYYIVVVDLLYIFIELVLYIVFEL